MSIVEAERGSSAKKDLILRSGIPPEGANRAKLLWGMVLVAGRAIFTGTLVVKASP